MKNAIITFLIVILVAAAACSPDDTADSARLDALEAEVKALKEESRAREKALSEELAMIRVNLEGIQDVLQIEKGRADLMETPEAEGEAQEEDLDAKAKSFVSENLDRLLAITKKLLDKMERELDKQMKEDNSPATPQAPEGDQI